MSVTKKKRQPKRSLGQRRGSRRVALAPVEKVLLGGGLFASFKPIGFDPRNERGNAGVKIMLLGIAVGISGFWAGVIFGISRVVEAVTR